MLTCDVAIVGGGPAGSTCARQLRQAGLDVVVLDRAVFPRDKPCAGWITPRVVDDLQLDTAAYAAAHTFQPITGFRVGLVDGDRVVDISYDRAVSFAIRRCELDHYLLQRSGARLMLGVPVGEIRREGDMWVVGDRVRAPMLVGAGGHFCPVARHLNASPRDPRARSTAPLVVAREAEWEIPSPDDEPASGQVPELYFCRDLKGYGWCVRKGAYLNVGLGRLDTDALPDAVDAFVAFLARRGRGAGRAAPRWRGHAYLLRDAGHRRILGDGVVLAGDAAGLAHAQSGEGIGPAIASGLQAAATILAANGRYTRDRLEPYGARLFDGVPTGFAARASSRLTASPLGRAAGRMLLHVPPFVRHVVLDRWFLNRLGAAS